jgi:hypothetical protein
MPGFFFLKDFLSLTGYNKIILTMASIKLLLGMVPATSKIEQEEKALVTEFEKLKAFADSSQLARYNELNQLVNSAGFVQKKKETEALKYKGSDGFTKEKEFNTLQKAKDILMYFRTAGGSDLKRFRELEGSEKISKYEALRQLTTAADFREKMKSKDFSTSEDAKKLAEFRQLDGTSDIKDYYRFGASKEYANFKNLDGSSRLARYNELKEYTASKEFTEKKAYLLDTKRYEKSDDFKALTEYNTLKKDPDITWYVKVKDSTKFDSIKNRELLFSDEFEGDKLDEGKWLTNYYWGEKLLKDRYSIDTDLHYYTPKENFEVRNSYLKINTKPQKATGKAWSPSKGFTTKEFQFTSGIVNTGISYRAKYGLFTAKIKLGDPSARSAFWLVGEKSVPHVNICHTEGGKVWFGSYSGNGKAVRTKLGAKYSSDSFIFSLEWTAASLIWKINGVEVLKQTENVPQEPMYVNFAGGVSKPIGGMTSMEIDWVRVYKV